ncbi:hypothetical protein LWI29_017571 [Acer saccharum]|uniref:SKP1-like protein n=1 Tax=Acer saccharum TaxID=4024 RepID=A0AA39RLK2_ACESA|nr:hypothetical protein LWI29_017571 [Acer saccharum]
MKITLKSSDGEAFEVDEAVVLELQTINDMIKVGIPLPSVSSKILSKVIEYCKKHGESPSQTISRPGTPSSSKSIWILSTISSSSLLDLTCFTVVDMTKGKTKEEILKMFNMDEFTPEEK